MLSSLAQRAGTPAEVPADVDTNPYRAKKTWPPDFAKLSPKHQFRYERRYKRRAQLKWARPRWMVATKLAQWGAGVSLLIYGVLFMEWDKNHQAFKPVRDWYSRTTSSIWTTPDLPPPRQYIQSQAQIEALDRHRP